MNIELLKLFNIDYEKPAGSIKLTFRVTPIQRTKYSVFIENAYNYYCKTIVKALNLPSINYMDVLSEEEFAQKSGTAFTRWVETYKDMERAYRHISDAFRFPYVLTKNMEGLTDKYTKDEWTSSATDTQMYKFYYYLRSLYNTREKEQVSVEGTVYCDPGDVIFLINPRQIVSTWVADIGFEMGYSEDSCYVRKVLQLFDSILDRNDKETPFYYCQFDAGISGEFLIDLVRVYPFSTSDELSFVKSSIGAKADRNHVSLLENFALMFPKDWGCKEWQDNLGLLDEQTRWRAI